MSSDRPPSNHPHVRAPEGAPRPGDIVAFKYQVERVLGAGGMGVVVAARHLQLGQQVAIKFIRGDAATDRATLERFLREARAAVALKNEHVTKVFDVGTLETGEPYIVMEFLDGTDLGELLRRNGALSVADAVGAVLQASEAIAEAHSLGIVHRDLKPSNLFVTRSADGESLVKVLDFGISKMTRDPLAGSEQSLTATGSVIGSPGYMSPEQVRSAKDVDPRSDVWALGVILYELLSGVQPFRGETIGETFAKILTESAVSLRVLQANVPEGLADAISQCLERDRKKRTQGVDELASRLLPFAPPQALRSIERILRVSGDGPGRQETLPARTWTGSDGRLERGDSGGAWLRSRTAPGMATRLTRRVAFLVSIGAVACVAAAALYVTTGRPNLAGSGSSGLPSGGAAPASAPSALPAPTFADAEITRLPPLSSAIAVESADAGAAHSVHSVHLVPPGQPATMAPSKRPAPNPSTTAVPHERDVF